MKKGIVLILSFFVFVACIRTNEELTPWKIQKPVVYSFITPNQPVKVYIDKTYIPSDSSKLIPFAEARVFIKNSQASWIELKRLSPESKYFIDNDTLIRIIEGQTYNLKVELKNTSLTAKTIVPLTKGKIQECTCTNLPLPSNHSVSIMMDGKSIKAYKGLLKAKFILSDFKNFGYSLFAFESPIDDNPFIQNENFSYASFYYPQDINSFKLNLYTFDSNMKSMITANLIESFTDTDENNLLMILISNFGGVLPQYSNVENGVGLFGSFLVDEKLVYIK